MACGHESLIRQQMAQGQDLSEIDATGRDDVTGPLNAYLASVPDGSTITFPAGARYRVEGILELRDRHNLTIEGNGATIFATTDGSHLPAPHGPDKAKWPRRRAHLKFDGGGGHVVRNLTIDGPNSAGTFIASLEAQAGISLEGVRGIEIDRVTIRETHGDGVHVAWLRGNWRGHPDAGRWTSGVHVHDSRFEVIGRQGVAVDGGEDVLLEGGYIGEVGRSLVDLEPAFDNSGARRITIRGMEFGNAMGFVLASLGQGSNVEDIIVEDNTAHGPFKVIVSPPPGHRRRNIVIRNNRGEKVFGSPVALMRFHRIDAVTITGNYIPISTEQGRLAVLLHDCTGFDADEIRNTNEWPPDTPPGREPAGPIIPLEIR